MKIELKTVEGKCIDPDSFSQRKSYEVSSDEASKLEFKTAESEGKIFSLLLLLDFFQFSPGLFQ